MPAHQQSTPWQSMGVTASMFSGTSGIPRLAVAAAKALGVRLRCSGFAFELQFGVSAEGMRASETVYFCRAGAAKAVELRLCCSHFAVELQFGASAEGMWTSETVYSCRVAAVRVVLAGAPMFPRAPGIPWLAVAEAKAAGLRCSRFALELASEAKVCWYLNSRRSFLVPTQGLSLSQKQCSQGLFLPSSSASLG
jgi:hypothetical protein